MKKFLKNNHLIVFILINLLVSAKTKEKRKYKKETTKKIYIPNKQNPPPMDPSPIITIKTKHM